MSIVDCSIDQLENTLHFNIEGQCYSISIDKLLVAVGAQKGAMLLSWQNSNTGLNLEYTGGSAQLLWVDLIVHAKNLGYAKA